MPHTNTTKKAAGASNTNGPHTDANKTNFRSHGSLNQVPAQCKACTSTSEKGVRNE
jgi:hypothetical protein